MATKKNLLEAMENIGKSEISALKNKNTEIQKSSNLATQQNHSRNGKKSVIGYFDPLVNKQLKLLAIEKETSIQALLGEAINDLFEKNGKSRIV